MIKNLTYDVTVTIEAALEVALKKIDEQITYAEMYALDNLETLKDKREAIKEAAAQVSEYGTYLANYGEVF